jgi:predicted dinucleotide-utilizing enzyme
MDYLAYDRVHHRVWVPAGNTGSVDVVDAASDKISKIDGFVTRGGTQWKEADRRAEFRHG